MPVHRARINSGDLVESLAGAKLVNGEMLVKLGERWNVG